jgi:hypothetical protein
MVGVIAAAIKTTLSIHFTGICIVMRTAETKYNAFPLSVFFAKMCLKF